MTFVSKMVDMAKTPEELSKDTMPGYPVGDQPLYPYGLSICFTQDELEKLDLEDTNIEVGDMLHLFCLVRVTSVSQNETASGKSTRVEMTLTHIATESEDEENEEYARQSRPRPLRYE